MNLHNGTLIFAHRGASGTHPENTMTSFEKAYEVGSEGIELDVHLTKDGEVVVLHDEKVDRTTDGTGFVQDKTEKEMKQLDAGVWFSQKYKGEKIPTLQEVLEWISNKSMRLNIELKNDLIPYKGLEEKVIQMVHNYGLSDSVILSSFNHYSLVKVNQISGEIKTAVLTTDILYQPWHYVKSLGASALHCSRSYALSNMVAEAQKYIPVRAFTINDETEMKELLAKRLSALMTDFPERAIKVRSSLFE
ncbi:glycerophosphodiester phosphodiesterase [Chengkuizengella axinellae]|uniref:Glycerophosphodiester phosphodiesterase n=1 Tax=Chengkuizengella axinellae TaxID=3064388 RepID=A0ABT9IU51_9BACL|nr:glycerophosphodiester phosphodiesterase [Chengkuizengella sp. 2205SS18-9]MDP5272889.1 glycerophosphodiester phosphodiesterase [Chengkuizengella sp. 2205SS18-9]